jgi:hypothetical protein
MEKTNKVWYSIFIQGEDEKEKLLVAKIKSYGLAYMVFQKFQEQYQKINTKVTME